MIQPMDTLSQLALCCGFGNRRREFKPARNYFYSPSTALLDPGNTWPLTNQYGPQPQPQPYFLLTQPVIIANNPTANPMNTITLVQHAQSGGNHFPGLSILGTSSDHHQQQHHQPHSVQSNIISSQYAVYNSTAPINNNIMSSTQATAIYNDSHQSNNNNMSRNQSAFLLNKPLLPITRPNPVTHQIERQPPTLNSDLFKQLEVIEKQVDLSKEIELLERHGITSTRTLDPYSLMSETLLRKYHERFLTDDESAIKFVEIVKRPGQTLGLYIRSIHFDNSRGKGARAGLIITKIDTDSPIYNNQVLHVGDEILSINLIDIAGMNLDDVVILMSIPKRLVLALRVPRDRDFVNTSRIVPQQMLKSSTRSQENLLTSIYQQHNIPRPFDENLYQRQLPYTGNARALSELDLLPSNCIENRLDEAKEGSRHWGFINQDKALYSGRPLRVQSAAPMNELNIYDERARNNDIINSDQMQQYSSDCSQWSSQNFRKNLRPIIHNQDTRLVSQFERQGPEVFKPRDEAAQIDRRPVTSEIQDFVPMIPDMNETFIRKIRSPELDDCRNTFNSNEKEAIVTPVTLPRRTLPTRPDIISSPTTIKQPIINNLRLSDTPEQSSYFSSSIDAINRELKELRRQRLALNENDKIVESSNV